MGAMNTRIDYDQVAAKLNYAALDKKLEELRDKTPPKNRKGVGEVLAPLREKLTGLHRHGWTYAQLAAELNGAGLPVKAGTLREYLSQAGKRSRPRHRARATAAAAH